MKKKSATASYIARAAEKPAERLPALAAGVSRQLTTSLFPADLEALESVYALISRHCGARASRSDAIKMGLRMLAEGGDPAAMRRHYAAIKQEDGRNKGKA